MKVIEVFWELFEKEERIYIYNELQLRYKVYNLYDKQLIFCYNIVVEGQKFLVKEWRRFKMKRMD